MFRCIPVAPGVLMFKDKGCTTYVAIKLRNGKWRMGVPVHANAPFSRMLPGTITEHREEFECEEHARRLFKSEQYAGKYGFSTMSMERVWRT